MSVIPKAINNSLGNLSIISFNNAASAAKLENKDIKMKRSMIMDTDQMATDLRIILNSCLYMFMLNAYS
jgi:hypothetical protein